MSGPTRSDPCTPGQRGQWRSPEDCRNGRLEEFGTKRPDEGAKRRACLSINNLQKWKKGPDGDDLRAFFCGRNSPETRANHGYELPTSWKVRKNRLRQ